MKKKNLLMMALSLCMVAVIAVGGTLAYMTATDTKLTNTFEFAHNIQVSLTENWTTADKVADETATAVGEDAGYNYTNVVPGQELHKEPTISVTTGVKAYVFVRVDESSNVTVKKYKTTGENAWKELTGITGYKVLYKVVNGSTSAQDLHEIFSTVTVSGTATGDLEPITIEVGAIQYEGFGENVASAYAAAVFQTAQGGEDVGQ